MGGRVIYPFPQGEREMEEDFIHNFDIDAPLAIYDHIQQYGFSFCQLL
jgi:hypothetical protein